MQNKKGRKYQNTINQNVPDEFSKNLIDCQVEHYKINEENFNYNQAEIMAMQLERNKREELLKKQKAIDENMQKYKENIRRYNQKHKDNKEEDAKTLKMTNKKKLQEYNEKLRQTFKNKTTNSNLTTVKNKTEGDIEFNPNQDIKEIQESPVVDINKITESNPNIAYSPAPEVLDTFSFKITTVNNTNGNYEFQDKSNNNSNGKTKDITKRLYEQINDEIAFRTMGDEQEEDINEQIKENLQNLKNFRKNGFFTDNNCNNCNSGNVNYLNDNINNPTAPVPTPIAQNINALDNYCGYNQSNYEQSNTSEYKKQRHISKKSRISVNSNNTNTTTKSQSDLQQRRYQKALKKLMIEQLKNKSINIPSICSCGQLQRKIDSLLNESKTITYNDLMNVDCANNCIYYQRPSDYHRALTDIIQSIRNLKLENCPK